MVSISEGSFSGFVKILLREFDKDKHRQTQVSPYQWFGMEPMIGGNLCLPVFIFIKFTQNYFHKPGK